MYILSFVFLIIVYWTGGRWSRSVQLIYTPSWNFGHVSPLNRMSSCGVEAPALSLLLSSGQKVNNYKVDETNKVHNYMTYFI
jgi:hypothetical protein